MTSTSLPAPRVLAGDPSLTSFGLVRPGGRIELNQDGAKLSGEPVRRLIVLRDWWRDALDLERPDVVLLENYSYGSVNQAAALGELGGFVRVECYERKVPLVLVSPGQLKKYATGSGAAGKGKVNGAAIRQLGMPEQYDGEDDASDALWLHALGMHAYGHPLVTETKPRRDVINALGWPMLQAALGELAAVTPGRLI